jgi:integral membrane sensor domain MASE1
MKSNWLWQRRITQYIILNLLVAIAYAYGVNISHHFATLTGTVASVWFPSGMTLALVYLLGDRVILGIIGGSTYALTLELLKIPSLSVFNLALILIACACGNVLQPMSATYLIKKFARHKDIFSHVNTVVL